jgi:hypothetical protein
MTRADASIRRHVNGALGDLGPLLLAASKAVDGPEPAESIKHLVRARDALADAIFAAESARQPRRQTEPEA